MFNPTMCHVCQQDYELRHYEATKWASVQTEAATRDEVNTEQFMTLFKYITGENTDRE